MALGGWSGEDVEKVWKFLDEQCALMKVVWRLFERCGKSKAVDL